MTEERLTFTVEIDLRELAVRLCEAQYQLKHPPELSFAQAFDALEPEVKAAWLRTAEAAVVFLTARINHQGRTTRH